MSNGVDAADECSGDDVSETNGVDVSDECSGDDVSMTDGVNDKSKEVSKVTSRASGGCLYFRFPIVATGPNIGPEIKRESVQQMGTGRNDVYCFRRMQRRRRDNDERRR